MEQNILISVIVPVYNVEEYLPRCVDSILAQTYRNLEVILVDDGTKDNSDQICDAYAAKDSRIKVIHKKNGGLSSARNAGMDIAKGEYFGFVDSDDWIEPETYETMLGLALKHDAKMVCGGRYDVDSATGEKIVGLCPRKEEVISGVDMLGRVFLWDQCDSAAWDKLYHRSLFQEIRYPSGLICEDVAIFYRLVELTEKVVLCDKPLYNYYHREGSITTSKISEKTFHFQQHTDIIFPYIQKKYPEISKQAEYFRVRALVNSVIAVDLADEESRAKYEPQCNNARKELKKHIGYIISGPYFGKQERLTDLLLALGIYLPLKRIYHKFK